MPQRVTDGRVNEGVAWVGLFELVRTEVLVPWVDLHHILDSLDRKVFPTDSFGPWIATVVEFEESTFQKMSFLLLLNRSVLPSGLLRACLLILYIVINSYFDKILPFPFACFSNFNND